MIKKYKAGDYRDITLTPNHHTIQMSPIAAVFEAKQPTDVKVGHPPGGGVPPVAHETQPKDATHDETHHFKAKDVIILFPDGKIVVDMD